MMQNPNAIGAIPAQGNPQQGQSPKLPPQALAVLRKDPEIIQAVAKFAGHPVPMESIPDNLLQEIAGAVHKLGVDGAVMKFKQVIPPEIQQRIATAR
jgi:hypothetical protein